MYLSSCFWSRQIGRDSQLSHSFGEAVQYQFSHTSKTIDRHCHVSRFRFRSSTITVFVPSRLTRSTSNTTGEREFKWDFKTRRSALPPGPGGSPTSTGEREWICKEAPLQCSDIADCNGKLPWSRAKCTSLTLTPAVVLHSGQFRVIGVKTNSHQWRCCSQDSDPLQLTDRK